MSGLCSFNIRTRWLVLLLFFDRRLFGIFGKLIIFYYIQKSFVFFNEFFNSILPSYLSRDTRFSQVSNYFSHPWNKAKKLFSSSRHEISTSGIILTSSKFSTSQIDTIYKSIRLFQLFDQQNLIVSNSFFLSFFFFFFAYILSSSRLYLVFTDGRRRRKRRRKRRRRRKKERAQDKLIYPLFNPNVEVNSSEGRRAKRDNVGATRQEDSRFLSTEKLFSSLRLPFFLLHAHTHTQKEREKSLEELR